jgi:hypothetical protein
LLIQKLGLIGVAIGTMIPAILFQSFAYPAVLCKMIGISFKTYVGSVVIRPALVCLTLLFSLSFLSLAGSPTNWLLLVVHGTIALVLGGVLSILLGLSSEEKFQFILGPAKKYMSWFGLGLIYERTRIQHFQKNNVSPEEIRS